MTISGVFVFVINPSLVLFGKFRVGTITFRIYNHSFDCSIHWDKVIVQLPKYAAHGRRMAARSVLLFSI
jgi:hypothetical protein